MRFRGGVSETPAARPITSVSRPATIEWHVIPFGSAAVTDTVCPATATRRALVPLSLTEVPAIRCGRRAAAGRTTFTMPSGRPQTSGKPFTLTVSVLGVWTALSVAGSGAPIGRLITGGFTARAEPTASPARQTTAAAITLRTDGV